MNTNILQRVKTFLAEAKAELKKVTWPSKDDTIKTTIAVVVSSFIFGIYLAGVDVIFSTVIKYIIKAFQ
jgi:preprotein translocase subunit SecE